MFTLCYDSLMKSNKMTIYLNDGSSTRAETNYTFGEVEEFVRTLESTCYTVNGITVYISDDVRTMSDVFYFQNGIRITRYGDRRCGDIIGEFFFSFDKTTRKWTDVTAITISSYNFFSEMREKNDNARSFYCDNHMRIEPIEEIAEEGYFKRDNWGHIIKTYCCKEMYCEGIENAKSNVWKYFRLARCACCGKLMLTGIMTNLYTENGHKYVCPDCEKNEVIRCAECGNAFLKSDHEAMSKLTSDDGINFYDECCYRNSPSIEDYHSRNCKVTNAFYHYDSEVIVTGEEKDGKLNAKLRKKTPFMGFELEVDNPDYCSDDNEDDEDYYDEEIYDDYNACDAVGEVNYLFPKRYLSYETDGSLTHGWENISMPSSIEYYTEETNKNNFKEMLRTISDFGFRSHDAGTCGFHIHIDKAYFPYVEAAEAKLIMLFELHWNNLLKFSRRNRYEANQWAKRYVGKLSDVDTDMDTKKFRNEYGKKKYDNQFIRYHAVNVTNKNTIEIRLWRGTLNIDTFMATLKFTARLAKLAKTVSAAKLIKMSWEEILGDDEDILNYWETVKNREI